MNRQSITLPRSEWAAIADRAMKTGDRIHFEENEERRRAGSFPSAGTPEASEHWGISNFIRRELDKTESDPVTIEIVPAMLVSMRMNDYLPAGV